MAILEANGAKFQRFYKLRAPNGKFWNGGAPSLSERPSFLDREFSTKGRVYNAINHIRSALTTAFKFWGAESRIRLMFNGCEIVETTWVELTTRTVEVLGA